MCSSAGDIEDITNCSKQIQNIINKDLLQKCKKCAERSSILLQKKDPFCKLCFLEYCNHKFRSTIGKSKKIKHGDKVLLAYSGGRKSAALLHMTMQTLKSASAKQISFTPGILFIDDSFIISGESKNTEHDIDFVLTELKKSGYTAFYSSLEMVYKVNSEEVLYTLVTDTLTCKDLCFNNDLRMKMVESFSGLSLSSKVDLLKHLRLLLITEIAKQADYTCVFVGESASLLAVELLSDIALGRGSQISSDTSFYDSRYKVPVCRPLREFSNKEIALYNHLHCTSLRIFPDFPTKTSSHSCIQRLTETFLSNLQENFPATVFTVFRTGSKLSKSSISVDERICLICQSKVDNTNRDLCSALEALKISERISLGSVDEVSENTYSEQLMQYLCHGCSNIFENMSNREHFHSLIPEKKLMKMERNEMEEEIQEFLIRENDIS